MYKDKKDPRILKAARDWYHRQIGSYEFKRKLAIRQNKNTINSRKKCFEYMGNKCTDCGETNQETFEFDHIIPRKGNLYSTISHIYRGNWEKTKKELNKCELVCANCHRIRTRQRLSEEFNKRWEIK